MKEKTCLISADLKEVTITDSFWSGIIETIRTKVIPYQWEALNDRIEGAQPSHAMDNFRIAAKLTDNAKKGIHERGDADIFEGYVFQDSDFYKWIEAVGYSLITNRDEELEKTADSAIDLVCSAARPDGYLNTYYIINGLDKRFTNLRDNHELYCLGHLIEGAVAYYQATGKRKLLDAAIRYTDLVDDTFGADTEGKINGYPGHEIIEMALIRLYEVTGEKRYPALAKYFIDERGKEPLYFIEEERKNELPPYYWRDSIFKYQYQQAGKPVRKQDAAEGHAVRAVYLYSGMADVARLTGDEELMAVCERLWDNITLRQMYITGGIGASAYGEAFTYDFDLPNDTVYAETCASIGLAFFANRMLYAHPHAKYADVIEKTLYNGILSGMSLDGTKFFYVNPLEVIPEASEKDQLHRHVRADRQKWFGCACCPPNLARILSSLGKYAYGKTGEEIFVHLFISGNYRTDIAGTAVSLKVRTSYPWGNIVSFTVGFDQQASASQGMSLVHEESQDTDGTLPFTLAIRIPGWCRESVLTVNGKPVSAEVENGYAYIRRNWRQGDTLDLVLAMPVVVVSANPKVRENIGKAAVMRGPIVYCIEEEDNGKELHRIFFNSAAKFTESFEEGLLGGGVVRLQCDGYILDDSSWGGNELYLAEQEYRYTAKKLTWIPYYAWANRTPGEMRVWVNRR